MACGIIAVVVGAVAIGFSLQVQNWNVTGLVRMDDEEPIASFAYLHDRGFAFVPEGHYDGVYFYAIAIDPLARGETHDLIDHAAYRYGHAGYGWIAWLLTLGKPALVPYALLFSALAAAGIGAYAAARIAAHLGWSPWGGLAVALQPGLVYSLTVLTSEAVGFAVVGLALLFWLDDRIWPAAALLAFAPIVKEPFVLIPVALFLWEVMRGRKELARRGVLLGATLIPTFVWQLYIYAVFDITSVEDTASPLQFPTGFISAMRETSQMGLEAYMRTQVGTIALPLLVVCFALFIAGMVRAVRMRSLLDPVYLLQALVVFGLSPAALTYPKDFLRTTVFAAALVIPVVFSNNRIRLGTRDS